MLENPNFTSIVLLTICGLYFLAGLILLVKFLIKNWRTTQPGPTAQHDDHGIRSPIPIGPRAPWRLHIIGQMFPASPPNIDDSIGIGTIMFEPPPDFETALKCPAPFTVSQDYSLTLGHPPPPSPPETPPPTYYESFDDLHNLHAISLSINNRIEHPSSSLQ